MLENRTTEAEQYVTHSGQFHLDDVTAYALLSLRNELLDLPAPELTRTRDTELFKTADWLVDVGGEYDPESQRLDHHQFSSSAPDRPRHENGVPFAAAGMMWASIGHECIAQIAKRNVIELSPQDIQSIFEALDHSTFQGIDAEDNGELSSVATFTGSGKSEFLLEHVSLADVVRDYNGLHSSAEEAIERFEELATTVKHVLYARIAANVREGLARNFLSEGTLHCEGKVLLLKAGVPPEIDAVFHEAPDTVEFTVYNEEGSTEWEIRCTPLEKGSFDFKGGFPQEWRGLLLEGTDGKPSFAEVSGVASAIFCHGAGFFAKAGNKQDAIELATIAARQT